MFAGLMRLECPPSTYTDSCAQHQSAQSMEEVGLATPSAGSSSRKRLHRRPGYMRRDLPRLQGTSAGGEGRVSCLTNGVSGCPGNDGPKDVSEPVGALRDGVAIAGTGPSAKRPQSGQEKLSACYQLNGRYLSSSPPPLSWVNCSVLTSPCSSQIDPKPTTDPRPAPALPRCPSEAVPRSTGGSFSSSFSFIQQSLGSSQTADEPHGVPEPSLKTFPPSPVCGSSSLLGPELGSADRLFSKSGSLQSTPAIQAPGQSVPKRVLPPTQSESVSTAINQSEKVQEQLPGEAFWQVRPWGGREVVSDLANGDLFCLDTEATSSLSVDSDAASASSVTSGYESATPTCDQGWDRLVKKYEGILQGCLQNNRANAKIESMMLKLQRLQQKAILDDDYDTAERFGKKLEELRTERGSLSLGLPSRQPSVALFLQRLRKALHSALQRTDDKLHKDGPEVGVAEGAYTGQAQSSVHRRDRLIQEKQLVESEMAELQRRLLELQERRQSLEQRIQQEEQDVEAEEVEGAALRTCSPAQLRDMSRALEDLVDSQHRTQILQEQEQALSLSIKEATAKVVMSQRLGGSLRRKVSETETQLLALHEAKLAAISGNDFGSAKELKAEMRAVYVERDRLDSLAKRLHSLSSGNSHELARMKEQQQQIKRELEQREAQHEDTLRENAVKYVELLEDRLPGCSCPALERVWEADLEACHLFLRGLQLRTPSCSGPEVEDLPTPVVQPHGQPCTKEKEDCAMLTALGGRWCPEANLQNSEFTKKLEEFLFCMEDNHPEDECREAEAEAGAEAADLTEQCELISDRLMTLEDSLQTAILNRDLALTQSLEAEVRKVKATLQTMLAQLEEVEEEVEEEEEEEDEDDEDQDNDIMEGEIEEGEDEEEDQYFSDSWDI